jgi:uncharacterized protein (DUF58 family)
MYPPATLLNRLMTSRLLPSIARPTVGIGERRSRQKGSGMEFVDYRSYRAGDDIRHLDVHVMARSGEPVIKQYAQMRQLPVTIMLDNSNSMGPVQGAKSRLARQIAQTLGFVALASSDRVQVVANGGAGAGSGGTSRSPRWQGVARAQALFAWIAQAPAGGAPDLGALLGKLLVEADAKQMLIVISDWWDAALVDQFARVQAVGHELLALQVLDPAERDPRSIGRGMVTLTDSETGNEIEVGLDETTLARYRVAFETWQARLAEACRRRQWRFLSIGSDEDLSDLVLRRLRQKAILS